MEPPSFSRVIHPMLIDPKMDMFSVGVYAVLLMLSRGKRFLRGVSRDQVAKSCRCSRATLVRSLKILEDANYIRRPKAKTPKFEVELMTVSLKKTGSRVSQNRLTGESVTDSRVSQSITDRLTGEPATDSPMSQSVSPHIDEAPAELNSELKKESRQEGEPARAAVEETPDMRSTVQDRELDEWVAVKMAEVFPGDDSMAEVINLQANAWVHDEGYTKIEVKTSIIKAASKGITGAGFVRWVHKALMGERERRQPAPSRPMSNGHANGYVPDAEEMAYWDGVNNPKKPNGKPES